MLAVHITWLCSVLVYTCACVKGWTLASGLGNLCTWRALNGVLLKFATWVKVICSCRYCLATVYSHPSSLCCNRTSEKKSIGIAQVYKARAAMMMCKLTSSPGHSQLFKRGKAGSGQIFNIKKLVVGTRLIFIVENLVTLSYSTFEKLGVVIVNDV